MNIDRSRLKTPEPVQRPRWQGRPSQTPPLSDVAPPRSTAPTLPPEGFRPLAPTPVAAPPSVHKAAPQPAALAPNRAPAQQPHRAEQSSAPKAEPSTNVTINITMPKLKRPTLPKWPYKRIAIMLGIAIGLVIASIIVHALISAAIEHRRVYKLQHELTTTQQRTKPTFSPLVPKDDKAVAKTAAFDSTRNSYSYSDTLKGNSLIVSQQPMPAGDADGALAKIAKTMSANTVMSIKAGKAYLASDKVTGAQTIVLGKNNLLVFVQSAFTHSNADWQSYLDGLST